ncbi:MAG: hypothetical protein ABSE91_01585 [Patescibacteria group bacterium]
MVALREEVWHNLGGMSRPRRVAPSHLPKWSRGLPWKVSGDIEVVMPLVEQLSGKHPDLVDQLIVQWEKEKLSSLHCSSGNFYESLLRGTKISLGHIWAEIYVLWLRIAMLELGLHDIECAERFRTIYHDVGRVEIRVTLYFSEPLPKQFAGLETLISSYLNRLISGQQFDLKARMAAYVAFRRAILPEEKETV